jgi:hypothetical protein
MTEERNPYATPDANLESDDLAEQQNDGPKGLGGWLILVGFGIIAGPVFKTFILISIYIPIFTSGQLSGLMKSDPGLGGLIQFEAIGHILLLAASLYLAFLFFSKKLQFPKWFITFTLIALTFVAIDTLIAPLVTSALSYSEPQHFKDLAQTAVSAAIWIPYMLRSKRVKNTFVN